MPVVVAMLRGVNVGGNNLIRMESLRELFTTLGFESPQTHVQSGNIVFKSRKSSLAEIASTIQKGIQKKFGCCPAVVLRSSKDLRAVVKDNPFSRRKDLEPAKLLVSFLQGDPLPGAGASLAKEKFSPEELHLIGRELYIYFPNGAGKSKLPWSRMDKWLGTMGTARNWNTVNKLLEMAETLETKS